MEIPISWACQVAFHTENPNPLGVSATFPPPCRRKAGLLVPWIVPQLEATVREMWVERALPRAGTWQLCTTTGTGIGTGTRGHGRRACFCLAETLFVRCFPLALGSRDVPSLSPLSLSLAPSVCSPPCLALPCGLINLLQSSELAVVFSRVGFCLLLFFLSFLADRQMMRWIQGCA